MNANKKAVPGWAPGAASTKTFDRANDTKNDDCLTGWFNLAGFVKKSRLERRGERSWKRGRS